MSVEMEPIDWDEARKETPLDEFQMALVTELLGIRQALDSLVAHVEHQPHPLESDGLPAHRPRSEWAPQAVPMQAPAPVPVYVPSVCPEHGKPWRTNKRGGYCATKLADGSWCLQKPQELAAGASLP